MHVTQPNVDLFLDLRIYWTWWCYGRSVSFLSPNNKTFAEIPKRNRHDYKVNEPLVSSDFLSSGDIAYLPWVSLCSYVPRNRHDMQPLIPLLQYCTVVSPGLLLVDYCDEEFSYSSAGPWISLTPIITSGMLCQGK